MIDHYHKFYFYFNISNIESSYRTLLSNVYILELKDKGESSLLINILNNTCFQIENELAKFNNRGKRSLFNGIGSAIRYVTGNLDQNDLREIQSNLEMLFANQESILKQTSKFISFANHITNRYEKDVKKIKENLNITMQTLNKINEKLEIQISVQYQIYLAENLLRIIKAIQRTISLAYNNITNLEIMSKDELKGIIKHLSLIYKKDELLELDDMHLFKIIEYTKSRIITTNNIVTCILYVPILKPNPYKYQRIYPIPNINGQILIPPAKFHLIGTNGEFWTNEDCTHIESQTICVNQLERNNCSLTEVEKCQFAKITNNYQLIKQLHNGNLLVSTKDSLKATEICNNEVKNIEIVSNTILSTNADNCKIIINGITYSNLNANFSINQPEIPLYLPKEPHKLISINQDHWDNLMKLKEDISEIKQPNELSQAAHAIHFSITTMLILMVVPILIIVYTIKKNNRGWKIVKPKRKEEMELEELHVQVVDALS